MSNKYNFHDVFLGLKKFRDFLLGRRHVLHGRFPPLLSSRTIPPPEIPRAPEYKYSDQYYHTRHVLNSVNPPVIAPVAEGSPVTKDPTKKADDGGISPECVCFTTLPTPGPPWHWDGHCYYEEVPDPPPSSPECPDPPPPDNKC